MSFDYLMRTQADLSTSLVHGGISPTLQDLEDIRCIQRPLDIQGNGMEADLIWSDPSEEVEYWESNDSRGVSFLFGPQQINQFLKKFNFDLNFSYSNLCK